MWVGDNIASIPMIGQGRIISNIYAHVLIYENLEINQ